MVAMADPKTILRCQSCRKVIFEVTRLVEVRESGIAISRKCKCGFQNEWKVRVVE